MSDVGHNPVGIKLPSPCRTCRQLVTYAPGEYTHNGRQFCLKGKRDFPYSLSDTCAGHETTLPDGASDYANPVKEAS